MLVSRPDSAVVFVPEHVTVASLLLLASTHIILFLSRLHLFDPRVRGAEELLIRVAD